MLRQALHQPTPEHQVFMAGQQAQPLGLLHLTVSTDFYQQQHAHLADLAVDAAAEGRGILVACADTHLSGMSCTNWLAHNDKLLSLKHH